MIFDILKTIDFPRDEFAVFGSGTLEVKCIRKAGDLDLVVKKGLWRELLKKYQDRYLYTNDKEYLKLDNIDISWSLLPWFKDAEKMIDEAEVIQGFRFIRLEHILEWKKQMGREKDKKDVKLIEKFLENKN